MTKTDKRTRRGAALIIAIAIMTVLLAIGLTFFTVARVESTTAMNVVNTVRAEHLVDGGFAMAEYQLNRDLQIHSQATSLDHGWRTMFNGAAYAGKNWANSTGTPAFNLEPMERALRAANVIGDNSLLYVKFAGSGLSEPLFRGPETARWLAIPRWQGNDILLYQSQAAMPLCYVDHKVTPPAFIEVSDDAVNAVIAPFRIVRFDMGMKELYPFVTSSFFDRVTIWDKATDIRSYPFGIEPRWPAEQVDAWADVDTNGDGMRESIWIPLPKDVDLSDDGIDNDLDGIADGAQVDGSGQVVLDADGSPRRDFEIGAFVYRVDNASGRVLRTSIDVAVASRFQLTIPLPGLRLPIDMNNDGLIDGQDYYSDTDGNRGPVFVHMPPRVSVPMTDGSSVTLTMLDVDVLDNDYDQFVNGFNAYVFLGNPDNPGHDTTAAEADRNFVQPIAGTDTPSDFVKARLRHANKVIKWTALMPEITLSANAPAWLVAAPVKPLVITLTGEPVCDVVGRAGIQVVDESSKVNMNAAGGHIYRDDLDVKVNPTAGEHIERAINQGASTFEYETRALPDMGVDRASDFWGMLSGGGFMLDPPTGSRWDYSPLPVKSGDAPNLQAPLRTYAYDISLPGAGRVDDNMNSLLFAFNGLADAGSQHPDQGLWTPPLSLAARRVLAGDTSPLAHVNQELTGYNPGTVPYAEVADAIRTPRYADYYSLLGMLEGIDDPREIQPAGPVRNTFAETDLVDNNGDGVVDEIGEAGDRMLANNYELQKAVDKSGSKILGDTRWSWLKNIVTANSDSRNVNYLETTSGSKAINKIDPNLAPPAQLAAGLLTRGAAITPVTAPPAAGDTSPKISLPFPIDTFLPDQVYFAEGLRQADTTLSGPIFAGNSGIFPADPELQAMQTAVNIADSRDADSARSLLVMEKQATAAYNAVEVMPSFYPAANPNPPAEPLNERERVAQGDIFPVGDLQEYLGNVFGDTFADRRVISIDQWWQNLTNASDGNTAIPTDREDRTISYAAAGVDAIRINEMMVRPVRRVEAEAVTHLRYNTATGAIDPTAPRLTLSEVAATGTNGATIAAQYGNLNPAPITLGYAAMLKFDVEAFPPVFHSAGGSDWNVQSYYNYDPAIIPATPNRVVLGDETAYRYEPVTPQPWTAGGTDPAFDINNDIVEFRLKATDGLPPGRYYLTVNVVDPVTGLMTVDDVDQLQYSVKYTNSTVNTGIYEDLAFIEAITPDASSPDYTTQLAEKNQLRTDYFEHYWQTVDEPEYIATANRRDLGSGAPSGWVFAPAKDPQAPLNEANYSSLVNLMGTGVLEARLDIPLPLPSPLPADAPYRFAQSYFRDAARGAFDAPIDGPKAGPRTFTVIVPPNDPTATYDTLCIAFRLKPMFKNLLNGAGSPPRPLAINFLDFSQQPDHEYVELANTTDKAINLNGWTLEVGIPDPAGFDDDPTMRDPFKSRWTIAQDAVIAPKGYLLLGFDKVDNFQGLLNVNDNLITRNGMGLASVLPNPADPLPVSVPEQTYVTVPPIAGTTTVATYAPLADLTASVFQRTAPSLASVAAGTVDTDYVDYIDNDGDGVSSAPLVYGSGSGGVPVALSVGANQDQDTDGVAVEAKARGLDDGTVPPFARIVPLRCDELWYASDTGTPYALDSKMVSLQKDFLLAAPPQPLKKLAELVLRGGVLPDYPEQDGHDNDGDGGFAVADKSGAMAGDIRVGNGLTPLVRYVRGTLDKDMVDNNIDGRIDECGQQQMVPIVIPPDTNPTLVQQSANPLHSEGVDEGRFATPVVQVSDGYRPRLYGYGSFEEGDLPLVYTPCIGFDSTGTTTGWGYHFWVGELLRQNLLSYTPTSFPLGLQPENGFPYNVYEFARTGLRNTGNAANYQFWTPVPSGAPFWPGNPAVLSEVLSGSLTSPEWKSFCERRWNPGDDVIVTLYVGPAADRKVADRVTYREQDVTNRAVDDIQTSPYVVDGYRYFTAGTGLYYTDTTVTPPVTKPAISTAPGHTAPYPLEDYVCLDRNRPQYWLPNQMGLDFYRSLERKHPLYAGDKFGTSNRWEATDGSYDDWSDSLSLFEAVGNPTTGIAQRPGPVPGAARLFGHALYGSPLRMNTQQRIWDNPPDLMAYLVNAIKLLTTDDPEGMRTTTIPLDGGKRRQFVESDSVKAAGTLFHDPAYALRRAEVRNRPFNSVGDLIKLPAMAFKVPLNTGFAGLRSTNAMLNTRWAPDETSPLAGTSLPFWRQDTTLGGTVLGASEDISGAGGGFAGLTVLTDINPVMLTVGQARFRPILSDPLEATNDTIADANLHWKLNGTDWRAPHEWAPVMLFADYPTATPAWSTPLARWTLAYPPPLPVGKVTPAKTVTWDPPAQWPQWYRWNNASVDAPYLVQAEFLFDGNHNTPVFGALGANDVGARWPAARLFPSGASAAVPLENVEYPRAVMYVSQHNEQLGENRRAEGVFSWDANDGLENGTYIAYVATFVPRMGQSLIDADNQVISVPTTGGVVTKYGAAIRPQTSDPTNAPTLGNTDPIADKICQLDPSLPHAADTARFDPVLALEFVTDPAVADRVAPPRSVYTPPDPGRPLTALPNPADWFPTTTVNGTAQSTAAAYHADGDGMILYSGSGQVTWRARLVRVTDNFLALRVRNLGRPNQVACITGVVLAPARHVAGKINVNTAENERIVAAVDNTAKTYNFSVFNTLLGLPGVVNALKTTRDPNLPDAEESMGGSIGPETDFGWPMEKNVPMTGTLGAVLREHWRAPAQFTGLDMPPAGVRTQKGTAADPEPNLLAPKNTTGEWNGLFDGVGAMRLSSMIMAGRTENYDGRYYSNAGELIAGAGKNGTLKRIYPLSNENVPEWRFDEIDRRFGRMANLITTRSDVFEILVTVQAGAGVDSNGDNRIDYRDTSEFTVTAESQGRVIYERRARTDRSDEAAR